MCAFKGMRRIKPCCNILITKPEKRCLFRNTQLLEVLDIFGTYIKHGGNNYQSCILAGIKNLLQEKNKHLTLSASKNQIESHGAKRPRHDLKYCLSCHGLQGPQSLQFNLLIDIYSNMIQHTPTLSDIGSKLSLIILNTWAFMPALNWIVFRRECNVLLEGMGNKNQGNA